ncbi:MAG TPA: pyrimidine dimer DNA glycosylase/endonuclease V [Gammaproteobacteria bacterium]
MRLWSLHPQYLDPKGLVALWREALLAQAVLQGKTRGYKHHPQLRRFQESKRPRQLIAAYLRAIHAEATRRGYNFDASKIGGGRLVPRSLKVTRGQMEYEWQHLDKKLRKRDPRWRKQFSDIKVIKPHLLFRVVRGGREDWEIV